MIDETDGRIIEILQTDARLPNAEIARQIGMAPSATLERIRKLEERGVIQGYTACLDPHAVGLGLLAFIFVRAEDGLTSVTTERTLAELPEVQELHHIAGEDCFLLKVRTRDTESLGRFLRERLGAIPTVRSTRTTIVLQSVKETPSIRLTESSNGGRDGRHE